jgi:hypothetical protein
MLAPMTGLLPAVLDLEASGFGRHSYPIEVGYVLPDGAAYCTLVRPAPDWTHWDPAAERLHGITRETAVRHGRSVDGVARHLNDQLRGLTLYCDGWAHDYAWLHQLFDRADMSPAFRLDNVRTLLSDEEAARWHAIKQEVSAGLHLRRHRASTDARLLQMTLARVRNTTAAGH